MSKQKIISDAIENLDNLSKDDIKKTFAETLKDATAEDLEMIAAEVMISAPSPDDIKTGSAKEFVYGCLTDQTETLDVCVPQCLAGYKPSKIKDCSLSVYQKKDGKLTCLSKKDDDKAYLYLNRDGAVKLSTEDRRILQKDGVKELYVYKQKKNGLNYKHIDTVVFRKRVRKRKEGSDNHKYIIIFVILLFIIIAAAFVQRSRKNSRKSLT